MDRILFVSMGLGMFFDNRGNVEEDYEPFIDAPELSSISMGYREDLFSLIMSTLELKSLLRISRKFSPDLVLIDGSLRNLITRHAPSPLWFGQDTDTSPEEYLQPILNADPARRGLIAKEVAGDDMVAFAMALYGEYLSVLQELFSLDTTIIGISKTTTSYAVKIIKELNAPDIVLFSYLTRQKGYSTGEYYIVDQDEEYKWYLPRPFEKLKAIPIYHMYVRLEDDHRVYRTEIIAPTNDLNVEKLVGMLQSISAQGYPLPLRIAHSEVRITGDDLDIIEQILIERGARLHRSREGL